jgi:hypothetical protein
LHDVINNISENHKSLARQVEQSSDTKLIQRFNELGLRIEKLERKFGEAEALLFLASSSSQSFETSSYVPYSTERTDTFYPIEDLLNDMIIQWLIDSFEEREEENEKLAEEKRAEEARQKAAYLRRMMKKREELKILLKSIEAKLSAAVLSTTVSLDKVRNLQSLADLIKNRLKNLPIIDEKFPLAA